MRGMPEVDENGSAGETVCVCNLLFLYRYMRPWQRLATCPEGGFSLLHDHIPVPDRNDRS